MLSLITPVLSPKLASWYQLKIFCERAVIKTQETVSALCGNGLDIILLLQSQSYQSA